MGQCTAWPQREKGTQNVVEQVSPHYLIYNALSADVDPLVLESGLIMGRGIPDRDSGPGGRKLVHVRVTKDVNSLTKSIKMDIGAPETSYCGVSCAIIVTDKLRLGQESTNRFLMSGPQMLECLNSPFWF